MHVNNIWESQKGIFTPISMELDLKIPIVFFSIFDDMIFSIPTAQRFRRHFETVVYLRCNFTLRGFRGDRREVI